MHSSSHESAVLSSKRYDSVPLKVIKVLGFWMCANFMQRRNRRSSPASHLLTVLLSLDSRSNICPNYFAFNFRKILKSYQDLGFSLVVLTSTSGTVHC